MPAASIFVEGGSGQMTRRGRPFPSRIIVRVFDEMGEWMPNEAVKFSLPTSLAQPTGRFPGGVFDDVQLTSDVGRAVSEVIDADEVLGTWLGTVSVVADPSIHADFYLSNVVIPFTPFAVQIAAGNNQSAVLGNAYEPVVARLVDEIGNGVSGLLQMEVDPGFGSFPDGSSSAFAQTDAEGYATFPQFVASGQAGPFNFRISYPDLPSALGDLRDVDPSVPAALQPIFGGNQAVPPGALFPLPFRVRVVNGIGTPLAGILVMFDAFPVGGASLVWAPPATDPAAAISDGNGFATSPSFSANGVEGTYTVFVTSPPAPFTGFSLTNGGVAPTPGVVNAQIFCEV